jgi:hypothetical protein
MGRGEGGQMRKSRDRDSRVVTLRLVKVHLHIFAMIMLNCFFIRMPCKKFLSKAE